MNNNISLSLKIVLGTTLILACFTAMNIYYSNNIFIKDKLAYLYNQVSLSNEATTYNLESLFENQTKIAQVNYELVTNQNLNIDAFYKIQTEYYFAYSYKIIDTFEKNLSQYYKNNFTKKELDEIQPLVRSIISSTSNLDKYNELFYYNSKNELKYLISAIKLPTSDVRMLTILNPKMIREALRSSEFIKHSIFFVKNELSKNQEAHHIERFVKKNINHEIYEIQTNDSKILTAQSLSKDASFIITSVTNLDSAINLKKFLEYKTILYALMSISLMTFIGIFFSVYLTSPLKDLTEKANLISKGNFKHVFNISRNDEIGLLSKSFEKMTSEINILLKTKDQLIKKLEFANKELERYMHKLESMVEDRTKELYELNQFTQAMINSLNQGLFAFDKDLNCHQFYTKACEEIFHCKPTDVKYYDLILEPEKSTTYENWAKVTFEGLLHFDSCRALLPDKIVKNDQTIKLEYYPLRNEAEQLVYIVAVATDISIQIETQKNLSALQDFASSIIKISKSKFQYQHFVLETNESIENLLEFSKHPSLESLSSMIKILHTLNGNLGLFYFNKAREMVIDIEQAAINQHKFGDFENLDALKESIINLKHFFQELTVDLNQTLGLKDNSKIKSVEISSETVQDFYQFLVRSNANPSILDEFLNTFERVSLKNFVEFYDEYCQNIAQKLNKKISPLKITSQTDIKINFETYKDVLNNIVHLLRNSLDHGIETPEERTLHQKLENGSIEITLENQKNQISLKFKDDGKGIDPEIVARKFKEKNPATDLESLSSTDKMNLIFSPMFSTKESYNSISGRGVGLSALKEAVDKIGGTIQIESEVGQGTTFTITLPKNDNIIALIN